MPFRAVTVLKASLMGAIMTAIAPNRLQPEAMARAMHGVPRPDAAGREAPRMHLSERRCILHVSSFQAMLKDLPYRMDS